MNLVNLLGKKQNKPQPEYFLALEIHEALIKSVVWELLDGEPSIVNTGSFEMWDGEDSLINGVDASFTEAIKTIDAQPKRVILGLPDSWLEDDKIHPSKNSLIGKLVRDLALEPIGMVTITQAIIHYLKKIEGIPPTAILLEIYATKIVVSVVELGHLKAQEEVARSGDIARDVEEGLTRMDLDRFPARFLLTNGSDLHDEQQQILAYPWQERLPFQHMPKVEPLAVDFSIKAIALTGGTEAAETLGFQIKEDEEVSPKPESNIIVPDTKPESSLEELGFSYEESEAPPEIEKESKTIKVEESVITSEPVVPSDEPEFAFSQSEEPEKTEEKPESITKTPIISPKNFFQKLPKPTFPKLSIPFPTKAPVLLGVILVPLLLVAVSTYYFFFAKAQITIRIVPEKISQQFGIAIGESADPTLPTLIATKKQVSGQTQESIPTTGEATVGDSASGAVTLVNKTQAPLILKAGTTVTSDNGKYKFTLDQEVTIASASSDFGSLTFGKASGQKVTATKIGAELNLPKDTLFTVGTFASTISEAKADSEFAGGSSRTVRAVSKEDQEMLLQKASQKIKSQTETEMQNLTQDTQALALSDLEFDKKEFSKKIGDEATDLSLDISGTINLLVYSKNELEKLVQEQLKTFLPPGSVISFENSNIKLENPVKKDNSYTAMAVIEASVYPELDQQKYADFIKHKNVGSIKQFFFPIKGYQGLNVKISPAIPLLSQFLPEKNISITLEAQ